MAIGAAMAGGHPGFSWAWLAVLGAAMFCMEVAKNAWGEIYDYDSGTDLAVAAEDRTNFSGGKRVLVDQLLSRGQTWGIAAGFTLTGCALGALMVFQREPGLFALGCLALFLGWSYHGPPLQLAYRGLGELDVVLIYGPAIALATYILMTGHFAIEVVWASLPLGVFTAAFLWLNEFPDHDADRSAGKRNLVVRLGKFRASRMLPLIYLLGLAALLIPVLLGVLPSATLLGALALVPAAAACRWCWREPETFHRRLPAQQAGLIAFVVMSAGISTGLLVG